MSAIWWECFCFVYLLSSFAVGKEEFHEELYIKPFPNGDVLTHFQFTTSWSVDIHNENAFSHYNLFPKSFGQIISKYSVEEVQLSLTQGFWNAHLWGYDMQPASPGAELAVWFQDEVLHSVDKEWRGLTNVLSGQFCASLNFIKPQNTASPSLSFRRRGVTSSTLNDSQTLRYSSLPREIVCTENLTPWKKLLPCDSKAGLSSLFNSLLIYKVKYHSMSIHLRTICEDSHCQVPLLELQQTLSIVTDPVLRSGAYDWSLRKLFGHALRSSCPLATSSKVFVDVTGNDTADFSFSLKPKPTRVITKAEEPLTQFAVYNLKGKGKIPKLLSSDNGFNLVFKWKRRENHVKQPYFFAHRFLTGYGEEHAGIQCEMYNHHQNASIKIIYFQMFPWHFRIFLHTLRIRVNDVTIAPGHSMRTLSLLSKKHFFPKWRISKGIAREASPIWRISKGTFAKYRDMICDGPRSTAPMPVVEDISLSQRYLSFESEYIDYVPSRDREKPATLELVFTLPPDSNVIVNVEFEKVFLKWTEHPPDAHHGFYLPSGVVTAKLLSEDATFPTNHGSLLSESIKATKNGGSIIRIYTEILLVSLPTPDFSMPYNVICLTCTVVAIAFGSLYNLATKQLQEVDPKEPSTLLGKMKQKLLCLKDKLLSRKKSKPEESKKTD